MSCDNHEKWNIADIVISFNKQIRKCIALVSNAAKYSAKSQALLDTARRRIKLVSDAEPLFLIDHAGKYLFRYKDVIHTNLDEFIMNPEKFILKEHRDEIENAKNNGLKKEDASEIDNILELLKEQWRGYSVSEKKMVKTMIQTMLSEYCKYLVVKSRQE